MVRVISSGFSTPRSRHSSGEEMIDRFAAMKALSALNDEEKFNLYRDGVGSGNLVIDSNTDTNDSFSGADSEEDVGSRSDRGINDQHTRQDPAVMKKERRKERNKLSAQNYRQRRRQQASAAQKTLESLEAHHKVLLEKVRQLEAEKHIVEEYLKSCVKVPWCPHHHHVTRPTISPHPPAIPEHAPVTITNTVFPIDNITSPMTSPNTQDLGQGSIADMNDDLKFNKLMVNSPLPVAMSTIPENNNNNGVHKTVPMDVFDCEPGTSTSMPLCMPGTSSNQSTGSSVS